MSTKCYKCSDSKNRNGQCERCRRRDADDSRNNNVVGYDSVGYYYTPDDSPSDYGGSCDSGSSPSCD